MHTEITGHWRTSSANWSWMWEWRNEVVQGMSVAVSGVVCMCIKSADSVAARINVSECVMACFFSVTEGRVKLRDQNGWYASSCKWTGSHVAWQNRQGAERRCAECTTSSELGTGLVYQLDYGNGTSSASIVMLLFLNGRSKENTIT